MCSFKNLLLTDSIEDVLFNKTNPGITHCSHSSTIHLLWKNSMLTDLVSPSYRIQVAMRLWTTQVWGPSWQGDHSFPRHSSFGSGMLLMLLGPPGSLHRECQTSQRAKNKNIEIRFTSNCLFCLCWSDSSEHTSPLFSTDIDQTRSSYGWLASYCIRMVNYKDLLSLNYDFHLWNSESPWVQSCDRAKQIYFHVSSLNRAEFIIFC